MPPSLQHPVTLPEPGVSPGPAWLDPLLASLGGHRFPQRDSRSKQGRHKGGAAAPVISFVDARRLDGSHLLFTVTDEAAAAAAKSLQSCSFKMFLEEYSLITPLGAVGVGTKGSAHRVRLRNHRVGCGHGTRSNRVQRGVLGRAGGTGKWLHVFG